MKRFTAIFVLLSSLVSYAQPPKSPLLFKLQGHSDDLECLALSSNGKMIASGSWDGMVSLFMTDSNYSPLGTFIDHFSAVNCIAFNTSGKVMATGGNDGKVFIYNIDTFGYATREKSFSIHRMSINSLYIDPGAKFVYTGSNDGTIVQFDILKTKEKKIINTNPVSSIAVANDRKTIYCSDNTSIIKRYDILNTNIPVINYAGHTDQINAIVLSKDSKILVSASSDKTVKIWNTTTGKLEKTLTGHDWKVITVAISANGKYVISGSNDGSTKLWDVETGKEIRSYDNLGTNVRGVAFSLDASKVYIAMDYPLDSFETKGILVLASGIEKPKKDPPKIPIKAPGPKGIVPKETVPKSGTTPESDSTKKIIKKTGEIEISEEKKKKPEPKKNDIKQD